MSLFFEGIKVGLLLCFMLGPIFFTLIQASVEEGFKAGLIVGIGIWLSDIFYVTAIYWGVSKLQLATPSENFTMIIGFFGASILLAFGLGSLIAKPRIQRFEDHPRRVSSIFTLGMKGLIVNAINPFTVLFWAGITATFSLREDLVNETQQGLLFFGGIITTIVTTDILKVLLAKTIRKSMRPKHFIWFRIATGIILIVFGFGTLAWALSKGNLTFLPVH